MSIDHLSRAIRCAARAAHATSQSTVEMSRQNFDAMLHRQRWAMVWWRRCGAHTALAKWEAEKATKTIAELRCRIEQLEIDAEQNEVMQ